MLSLRLSSEKALLRKTPSTIPTTAVNNRYGNLTDLKDI
jgi:hypothetical protein